MALIGRQSRNIALTNNQSESPGPGKYNISTFDTNSISYAPFSSCIPRFSKASDQKELGPGAYQIPTTIGSPSFIKFQNERNIIIKINDFGSAAFRSKSNRFQNATPSTPGVGDYQLQNNKVVKNKKRTVCKSADHPILKIIRQNNHEQHLRYEKQNPKMMGNNQNRQAKSLGPGEYNWDKNIKKQNGTNIWALSKVKRFSDDKKEQLEDPSVLIDNIKRDKEKEKQLAKPSSFFKSQTVKSYFDQITYETNSSVKLCIRKQLNYKSQSPAPGTYNVNTPKYEKNTFQFFGSTQQRFKNQEKDSSGIGPGQYILPSGFKNKNKKQIFDQSKRTDFQQNNWLPGPGTYDINHKLCHPRYHTSVEEFGSLEPRFKNEDIKVQNQSRDSKNQTGKNFNLNYKSKDHNDKISSNQNLPKNRSKSLPHKRNLSSFHSKSNYPLNFQEKSTTTPFGIYDLSKDDIGRVAQRERSYLNQLEESNLKRPPFNSGIERFKSNNNVQKTPSISLQKEYINPDVRIDRESSVFRSETKRDFIHKHQGPGVGSYKIEKSVVKDTFNRKYSNKPCGVKAKMTMRNSQKPKDIQSNKI